MVRVNDDSDINCHETKNDDNKYIKTKGNNNNNIHQPPNCWIQIYVNNKRGELRYEPPK
jgi:hypothetical protein